MLAVDASGRRVGVALTLLCGAVLALVGVLGDASRPGARSPTSRTVPRSTSEGTIEDANSCSISEETSYSTPAPEGP